MDATKHLNDFKPIDFEGNEVESSHLQLDSTPSDSQSKEIVESIHNLQLESSSFEAQSSIEVESNDLLMDSTPSKAQSVAGEILLNGDAQVEDNRTSNSGQCSYDPEEADAESAQVVDNHTSNSGQSSHDPQIPYVENAQVVYNPTSYLGQSSHDPQIPYVENAQVVDNHTSYLGQSSYDPEVAYVENAQVVDNHTSNSGQSSYDPQLPYVAPSPIDSNNPFTYKGVTYFSYEAFEQDFRRQLTLEMQMDLGAAQRSDDTDEPQFSDCMVVATGGSPAVINPHNGLPWRKGANLCRPYMDEGCCRYGTACIFHHPWPPTED